jgi:hypothetical protein
MKNLLSSLALAAGAVLVATPAAAAIVVSFVPTATNVAVGDSVFVDMRISGLGAEVLSAFDINALFDAPVLNNTVVSFFGASFGNNLSESYVDASFGVGDTGVVGGSLLDDATLAALQSDDFTVLRFTFTGVADGSTFLTLGADPLFQRNFVGLNFQTLDVEVQGTCISVGTGQCQVPEPASFGLAALAIGGALLPGALRRRRPLVA